MKVLMFGWEFPPHISGGLGTACAGLTQALEEENVDVIFVVPKLHGGEPVRKTQMVDASTISFTRDPLRSSLTTTSAKEPEQRLSGTSLRIEIPSALTPYVSPSSDLSSEIQRWSYSLDRQISSPSEAKGPAKERQPDARAPYTFSGKYGANLLEEVDRYAAVAAEVATQYDFDVIHAHDWMTYPAGLAARRVSGKPLILHVHATEVDRSGTSVNSIVFELEKKAMHEADHIVTVSQWTKNIAIKHYGVDEERISVVHNGVSQRNAELSAVAPPPPGVKVVTFYGRITHQKGPLYFVEAARRVLEKFNDVHFVVAGAGDQLPAMIERIAHLRLSSHFHFTGFLRGADIDRVWKMSSVYVMPSVSEPFGIAPLEAIEAGVPVIMSRQAGVAEVMPHAIKVDFWNCEALAEAICNVLRFPALARTLRINGSKEIRNITWNKSARKLSNLYHDLYERQSDCASLKREEKPRLIFPGASTEKTANPPVL